MKGKKSVQGPDFVANEMLYELSYDSDLIPGCTKTHTWLDEEMARRDVPHMAQLRWKRRITQR